MDHDSLFAAAAHNTTSRCGTCGHSLAGLVQPSCPECGASLAVQIVTVSGRSQVVIPAWWVSVAGMLLGAVSLVGWTWSTWSMWAEYRQMFLDFAQEPPGFWSYTSHFIDWTEVLCISLAAAMIVTGGIFTAARWMNWTTLLLWERTAAALLLAGVTLLTLINWPF